MCPVLEQAFSDSHDVTIVNSIDDFQKVRTYESSLVSTYDDLEREVAFSEKRPRIMHWLIAQSKNS